MSTVIDTMANATAAEWDAHDAATFKAHGAIAIRWTAQVTVFRTYTLPVYETLRTGYTLAEACGFIRLYEAQGMAVAISYDDTKEIVYLSEGV